MQMIHTPILMKLTNSCGISDAVIPSLFRYGRPRLSAEWAIEEMKAVGWVGLYLTE